tara:strand:- start:1246 stop:4311 length:3066 start_codon:yes stop_codon:yes gene_type:complete
MLKNIGVYGSLIISTMLVNSSALTVGMLLGTYSTSSYAQDEDKILKDLDNKYDISNPYRHNLESKTYDVVPRASRDMTSQLETMILKSNSRTNTLDIKGTTGSNADMTTAVKNANAVSSTQIMPSIDPTTNDVNVKLNKSRAFETYRDSSGAIKVRLKPGADSSLSPVNVSADEIYSSELNHGQTKWEGEGTYEDEDAFYQAGRDSNARLSSTANNTGEAVAYRTVLSNAQSGAQQTVPDAIMAQSYTTLDELETGGAGFFDSCGSTTVAKSGNLYAPNIEERFCQRLQKDNPFHCQVKRAVPVISDAVLTVAGKGRNILTVEFNLQTGIVKAIEPTDSIAFDFNVAANDAFKNMCSTDPDAVFSRVTLDTWEGTSLPGKIDKSTIMTELQAPSCANGLVGIISIEDKTDEYGDTEWILNAQAKYRFVGQLGEDTQIPEGCYDALSSEDKKTNGLTSFPPDPITGEFEINGQCTFTGYQTIQGGLQGYDEEMLASTLPWYDGDIENISWEVNLEGYTCDPFKGEKVCTNVEQPDGSVDEVCRSWDEIQSTGGTCGTYEEKDECVEIKTECTEGFTIDGWNYCVNETVTYECDTGYDVDFEYETTESSCEGMLPCSGGECSWGEKEENENFFKAAAIANVMEQIPGEASCDVPGDLSTCRIFEGERQYCSWATASDWGNDCCEAPEGIDFLDYLNMTQMMLKFENQQMGGVFSEPAAEAINGAWSTVSDSVTSTNAWESVSSFYTSAVETVTGNVATAVPGAASGSAGAAASTVAEAGLGPMTQYIYQLIYDALPEELGKLMFSTAVSTEAGSDAVVTGLSDGMASAANFLGAVMFWYSMYQLAQLVGSLLTACDEVDSDTALKLEMRQCYAVEDKYCAKEGLGVCYMKRQDYCCYGSILSRIVMEQAHVLLSKDMTECSGLTHEELQALDFNQIDLSEWIGVMIESNLIPESNQDDLSAGGRYENTEYRETPTERTLQRTSNAAEGAKAIKEKMNEPLDCSKYPRPQICEFGFTLGSEEGG